MPHRVAHHVQEGLERLVLDRPVKACFLAYRHHLDLPAFHPGRVVGHPDQALEEAPDGHDPDRLQLVPELDRQPRKCIAVFGHGNGRGLGGLGQNGQVVRSLAQPAQLAGHVGTRIDRHARLGRSGPARPHAADRGWPASGLRQLRARLAIDSIRSACSVQSRRLAISSETRSMSSSNRAAAIRIGPSAGRRCRRRGRLPPGIELAGGSPARRGRLRAGAAWPARRLDRPRPTSSAEQNRLEIGKRSKKQVDELCRAGPGDSEVLFQAVHQACQFTEANASGRPFERVKTPAQLVQRTAARRRCRG